MKSCFLEGYERQNFPWVIQDGALYVGGNNVPKNTRFGNKRIGLINKGSVAMHECKQRVAKPGGMSVASRPRTFEERIVAAYKKKVVGEEDSARQEWLELAASLHAQHSQSTLEGILRGLAPADAYIGTKGNLFALTKSSTGSFQFGNARYEKRNLGSTQQVYTQHRSASGSQRIDSSVVTQELSKLAVSHNGPRYTLQLSLPAFAMRAGKKTVAISASIIECDFLMNNTGGRRVNYPRVISPKQFIHPYVFPESRNICFGESNILSSNGVGVEQFIPQEQLADKMAFTAAASAWILRSSYDENSYPAHKVPKTVLTPEQIVTRGLVAYGTK